MGHQSVLIGPDERVPSVEFGFHTIACGCSRSYWQRISDDMSQDRRIARPLANGDDPVGREAPAKIDRKDRRSM